MKKLVWLTLLSAMIVAGCVESGTQQFDEMPEGPLLQYTFVNTRPMAEDTLMYVALWREDTLSEGGLLIYRTDGVTPMDRMPQPIQVSEAVFDSAYQRIKDHRLYTLADWYKTQWKGDAYGYAPWTLDAVFPDATLHTVSDGSTPRGLYYEDYGSVNAYLEKIYLDQAYKWLAEQPVNLADHPYFSNLQYQFAYHQKDSAADSRPDAPLTFLLTRFEADTPEETFTLRPNGKNQYRDAKTGRLLRLQWMADELMLTCYTSDEKPLWSMSAHESYYEKGFFEMQMKFVSDGEYTTDDGQKVTILNNEIKGFQGNEKQRCVIYDYHERPAERLHMGDYPNEKDYAFKRSKTGLNIYATEYERKDEYDWDSVPTKPILCLHRSRLSKLTWLCHYFLDSYILRYYSPDERRQMLEECEKATSPNIHQTWNAWLLRTFMDVVPFEAEDDYK